MAGLTPLSISLPLDKKTKEVLPDRDSYEAKVKKRGVKPDGSQKKQDFGSEYRDTQGKKPFENTRADALSPQTSPDTARASLLSGKSRISDPQHKLQPQGQARQSVIPDTDATNIVGTSSSSSPSLSTNITKEQIANVADKDSYRPTPGDSYASDQDGTDELATESDLETHAGDDDPNYSANPNEEDEGYDSLQSQFKNVRVRKRQRDDVEEAEDHNEVWQGDGLAHLDSNGKQKALNTHLTDEERTRQRKKSRTAKTTSAVDSRQDACGDEGTQGAGLAKNVVS